MTLKIQRHSDFTYRQIMISIRIYINHVPFMIAKTYRPFEAFSETIRSCSIDILKTDVVLFR